LIVFHLASFYQGGAPMTNKSIDQLNESEQTQPDNTLTDTTTPKRITVSKKIRFEIFKRDSFTCQYCGAKAPDVILECDHIEPVSQGGTNDILNLIASCFDCNRGKGKRRLSDDTVIGKQHQQLMELQERKEQIAMMFEWQKGLLAIDDEIAKQLVEFWEELVPDHIYIDSDLIFFRKLLKSFTLEEIIQAMSISKDQYLIYENNKATIESITNAVLKIGGICYVRRGGIKHDADQENTKSIYYIRGILRNRLSYLNEWRALTLLKTAADLGADMDDLEEQAKSVRNWTEWRSGIEEFIAAVSVGHSTEKENE